MRKIVFLFFLMFKIFYANDLITSNGTLKLNYSKEYNRIENIGKISSEKKFIKFIEEGIFYKNKIYFPIKEKADYIFGSNIIKIEKRYIDNIISETYIYISDRRNLVYIETNLKNYPYENFYLFYKIKPVKDFGKVDLSKEYYKYENFYFSSLNDAKLYFADEVELRNLNFYPLGKKQIKNTEKDLILLLKPIIGKNKLLISPNKIEKEYFDYSVFDEQQNWEKWIKNTNKENVVMNLVLLKMFQNRDGSITSFNQLTPQLNTRNMLYAAEAFLKWGYFLETERILTYLLYTNDKFYKGNYLISNDKYDEKRNEFVSEDEYGTVKTSYNAALFLYIFSEYIKTTNDYELLSANLETITNKVYYYLILKIKEGRVEKDSGISEKGLYDNYLETHLMVYKGLTEYLKLLEKEKPNENYKLDKQKIRSLKSNFNKFFIKKENLKTSIKNLKTPKLNQTCYLDEEIFETKEKYIITIRNLIKEYWRNKNFSSIEEIGFEKKLLQINYKNTFRKRNLEFENRLKDSNKILLNKYGEPDIEASSRYLILKAYLEGK